jgi:hypothetical protein
MKAKTAKRIYMLLGLNDFDTEMFFSLDDKNILIYYSDFESIPELADIMPVGSFDDETESYKWINLDKEVRLQVSTLFMLRDNYIKKDPNTKEIYLDTEIFLREFSNIPEIISFFDVYKDICQNWGSLNYPAPNSWIGWDKAKDENWYYEDLATGNIYINWTNYPDWCQECKPYTYEDENAKCSYRIPLEVIPPTDLYFISIVYFNSLYRVKPESVQDFGHYDILTDIDFEENKYSLIVKIKEFFIKEFEYFIQTSVGSIPFGADYGNNIKQAVQTKDETIRRIEVENEINFFIYNFNLMYIDWVRVEQVEIIKTETDSGMGTWQIDIFAKIQQEDLIFRIEVAEG